MKTGYLAYGAMAILLGFTVITLALLYIDYESQKLTEEEKQAEFESRYAIMKEAEVDGEEILDFARPVAFDVVFNTTKKETLEAFEVDAVDELPENVRAYLDGFDGENIKVTSYMLGFDTSSRLIGFLGRSHVLTLSSHYEIVCRSIPPETADKYSVTFVMLANSKIEDFWKKEILFAGTARELCAGEERSPRYFQDKGAVLFERPKIKAFPVLEEQITIMNASELKPGSRLFFARIDGITGTGMKVGIGFYEGQSNLPQSGIDIIEFSGYVDPAVDAGAPLYYITEGFGSRKKLIGFVGPYGPSAFPAEYVLSEMEEFPYDTK